MQNEGSLRSDCIRLCLLVVVYIQSAQNKSHTVGETCGLPLSHLTANQNPTACGVPNTPQTTYSHRRGEHCSSAKPHRKPCRGRCPHRPSRRLVGRHSTAKYFPINLTAGASPCPTFTVFYLLFKPRFASVTKNPHGQAVGKPIILL